MKKILIVDDVIGWRTFNKNAVKSIIENEEISIDTADSATNAYNLIIQNNNTPYDIIITDMQMEDDYMPKYAGEWLVEQIRSLNSYYNCKIIIVSASSYAKIVADNFNVEYIPKSSQLNSLAMLEEKIKF